MLTPYPTEIPTGALQIVIALLRGQTIDAKEAVHSLWQAIGYGLSQWDVHEPRGAAEVLTSNEAANRLESLVAGGRTAVAIPWRVILPLLLSLFEKWLKK